MKAEYNSKLDKNIEAFIQGRIEGKSFDEIATELKTTKQTLIDWNKKYIVRNAIDEAKAFKIDTLVKTYKFDLCNRIKAYLHLSKRINDELSKRELNDISTDVLLKMSIANDNRTKSLLNKGIEIGSNPNYYKTGEGTDGFFELKGCE